MRMKISLRELVQQSMAMHTSWKSALQNHDGRELAAIEDRSLCGERLRPLPHRGAKELKHGVLLLGLESVLGVLLDDLEGRDHPAA